MESFERTGARYREHGFTYLFLLAAVAATGLGLTSVSALWSKAAQRDKESELIFVGEQFIQAIGLYYQRTPGAVKRYPERLEDLILDRRYLSVQRYLRRIYRDPLTGKADWGVVEAPGGGVMGVFSCSQQTPIRLTGFPKGVKAFEAAGDYRDWRFVYEPSFVASVPPGGHPR